MNAVLNAVKQLKDGKTIAYPTEAVWGLGCDPYNENAFQEILKLKQRPIEKGVILLAGSIEQVAHLIAPLQENIRLQILDSWNTSSERATTWLLPATSDIPTWIKGNHPSVAVRVTQHPLCKILCEHFGGFIVSTSANPAGLTPATTLNEAQTYFKDQTYYLDGSLGSCHQPSKIVDALTGQVIRG